MTGRAMSSPHSGFSYLRGNKNITTDSCFIRENYLSLHKNKHIINYDIRQDS